MAFNDQAGQGPGLGPFLTDAKGTFTTQVTVDDPLESSFVASYLGSGPTSLGEWYAESMDAPATALPSSVPSPAGQLVSSAGTAFTANFRQTVLSGSGFEPNLTVTILLYPAPTVVATAVVDSTGAFQTPVTIPSGIVGNHTFVAVGVTTGADGVTLVVRYLVLPITVSQ
jgi:hypothetical protein